VLNDGYFSKAPEDDEAAEEREEKWLIACRRLLPRSASFTLADFFPQGLAY